MLTFEGQSAVSFMIIIVHNLLKKAFNFPQYEPYSRTNKVFDWITELKFDLFISQLQGKRNA